MTNPKEALEWYERKQAEARAMADRDCNNCRHHKADGCSRWDCEYEPVMSDLIKKSDAIKALYKYNFVSKNVIEREINAIPSAEPKTGKWVDAEITIEGGRAMPIQVCNLCNTFYPLAHTGGGYHYCPNCGAKMVREDGEDKE